jgi:hypothetical protein
LLLLFFCLFCFEILLKGEDNNVFLSLRHSQSGSEEFTSASVPATFANDVFSINWKITPNAVRGKGSLVLTAGPGQDYPIYDEEGKHPVRLDVNIGGDIDIVKKVSLCSLVLFVEK